VISGFRREVETNCALLGYYAALVVQYNLRNSPKERISPNLSLHSTDKLLDVP